VETEAGERKTEIQGYEGEIEVEIEGVTGSKGVGHFMIG
jgi:hypothetical protein